MQITVNKGVGFRMLKSINGFLQADNADEFFIQKANGHKYLRRIPKKSGKGYWYIYTETFKKPLQFLQQVFNISKERINTEFEENHIEKDYGANKQIYAAHILEYLTNKAKWDELFSKNENRERYKKAFTTRKPKKVQTERAGDTGKKETAATNNKSGKIAVNRSLMYKVWSLYNKDNKNSNESDSIDEQSRSEALQGNQNAKKDFTEAEKKRAIQNEKRKAAGLPQTALFERESAIKDSTWDPNSEEYRYKDTGYIAGSRKELAHSYIKRMAKEKHQVMERDIDWEGLEENPRLAKQLITKSNIFGAVDWDSLKAGGMTGGAAFLIDRIYAVCGKEPAEDSADARRAYVIGVNGLRDRLERAKTVQDVENTLIEIGEEMAGHFHSVRDTDEYKERAKKISEIRQKVKELKDKERKLFNACVREEYEAKSRADQRIRKYLADRKVIKWNQKWWGEKELSKLSTMEKVQFKEFQAQVKKEEFAKHDELLAAAMKFREENGYIKSVEEQEYVYPNGHHTYIDYPIQKELLDAQQQLESWEKIHGEAAMLENPLYKAWYQLGDKFKVITQHSYRNKTFYQHKADARRGNYDNWEWLKKETVEVSRKGRERKSNFEFIVAKKFNRKGGRNVTAKSTQELKELFNLRDVQSGNWVLKDPESAKFHVDHACEGFADLADITGIPDSLISLNGRLALAIGARGKGALSGGATAHYESVERVINITKMKGGGSLAHEWFHAFDNLISEAMQGGNHNQFLTNPYRDMSKKKADLLKEYMAIKNNSTIRQPVKELNLLVLEKKLDKEGIKLPEEGSREDYTLKVHAAFDKLVSSMTEGNEPIVHTVFYSADDYRLAQYNIAQPKGDFAQRIKSAGSLEKAVEIINQRFEGAADKKIIKNKSNWIKMTAAYYGGNKDGGSAQVDSGVRKSRFYAAAVQLDSKKGKEYWTAPHEMAARAFSAYIDDTLREQGRFNDYLAFATTNNFYKDPLLGDVYPYPDGEERKRINTAFKELFDVVKSTQAIRKALTFKPKQGIKYVLLTK